MMRRLLLAFNALVYLFILAPILVVIPVSFSEKEYLVFPPQGFSLRWYANFFATRELADSLWLSLHLAGWTTLRDMKFSCSWPNYRGPTARRLLKRSVS